MSSSSYQLSTTLRGARDAVTSLCFSAHTKFVSAVGYGGVTVWDLANQSLIPTPPTPYNPRNSKHNYTVSSWIYFETGDRHVLIAGTIYGDLMFMSWNRKENVIERFQQLETDVPENQIVSLDVFQIEVSSRRHGYIVFSTNDGRIEVQSLSCTGELETVFSNDPDPDFDLSVVRFCKKSRDIYAFEGNGGGIKRLDCQTGVTKSLIKYAPDPMASICMDTAGVTFAAYVGKDFKLLRLENAEDLQTFEGDDPIFHYPREVAFAENGGKLVGGSDRGAAALYDISTGQVVQRLEYPKGGLVLSVAVGASKDAFLIAIAGGDLHRPAEVLLYERNCPKPAARQKTSPSSLTSVDNNADSSSNNYIDFHIKLPRSPGAYLRWLCILILMITSLVGCCVIAAVLVPEIACKLGYDADFTAKIRALAMPRRSQV